MTVIAGLGNPGARYARTRHNAGFLAVERLARRWGVRLRAAGPARSLLVAEAERSGRAVLLVQPQAYMNRSGPALEPLLRERAVAPQQLLVVCDDMDLPLGSLRLRLRGRSGGHRVLESLAASLQTYEFPRLRLGIGRPAAGFDAVEHVLQPFTAGEWQVFERCLERAADAVEVFLRDGPEQAMNRFNGMGPGGGSEGSGSPA